jgi:hypothetical protein
MKSIFLTVALLLTMSSDLFSVPLAIKGRASIKNGIITCWGGRSLCAVIPRLEDNGPADATGTITVYDENGGVMQQISYSSISISEDGGGTTISWLP